MESFHILDPVEDLLVVVKRPTNDLFEDSGLVLDLVHIGEDAIPGNLQYEPSQPSSSDNNSTCTDQSGDEGSYAECVRFLVSSKHLSPVSSSLDLELRLDENACAKKLKIPVCVQDVDTLWILFSTLHCRAYNVPRVVDLEMLISVTALVQHFDCVEAVQLYAHSWIDRLYRAWPAIYTLDLPRWIWIARIHGHDALFTEATRIAIRECTGPIDLWGFDGWKSLSGESTVLLSPCREVPVKADIRMVLDTIETLRQEAIDATVVKLYDRIEAAKQGKYCCGEYDALILERLIQLLHDHGLYP